MPSKITQVVIDYYKEDPQAWDGADFKKVTYPRRAAVGLIEFLADEADDLESRVPMREDNVGLLGLLKDILKSENFSEEDLIEIGEVILTPVD